MQNPHTFLCSAVIVNEYDILLFEETFFIGAKHEHLEKAREQVEIKLRRIEEECTDKMIQPLLLSCFVSFDMEPDVMEEDLCLDALIGMYAVLRQYQKDGERE